MAWEPCDSEEKLRTEIIGFLNYWMKRAPYKARMPRHRVHVLKQNEKKDDGISVYVVTAKDTSYVWNFTPTTGPQTGRNCLEERQQIGLVVKAGNRSGGRESVSATIAVLKALFACPGGSAERNDLISRGVYNVFESVEGLQVAPSVEAEEGDTAMQIVTLDCTTDVVIR